MTAHQKTTEFLLAARYGHYDLVENFLYSDGLSLINAQDHFGTSALHLAAMYGQKDILSLLLSQPEIDANLQAYLNYESNTTYSPLDMAIKYKQPIDIIRMLVEAGASTNHSEVLLEMLFHGSCGVIENEKTAVVSIVNYDEFEQSLNILDMLIKNVQPMSYIGYIPISIVLQSLNASVADPKAKMLVEKLIEQVSVYDTDRYDHAFLIAKDFTHAFPSNHHYTVKNDLFSGEISAEGHLRPFVTNSFYDSVVDYQKIIKNNFSASDYHSEISGMNLANYMALKFHVFSELNTAYYLADLSVKHAGLYDTSKILYQFYSEGKTILIPTGWEGHAIDIVIDKNLALYTVANAGDRYTTFLPGGVHAYHYTSPISVEDIYEILNNSSQHNLEYEHYYKLGLLNNHDFSSEFPDQLYGNCGIYSLLMANWSLTYINIYKQTNDPILSKQLSDLWHQDVLEHHKTYVLKEYLSDPYFSDDKPLYDVLINYQIKLDHKEKIEQTELMLDYLTSPKHLIDFKEFYDKNQDQFSLELTEFIQKKGYGTLINTTDVFASDDSFVDTALVLQLENISTQEKISLPTEACLSEMESAIYLVDSDQNTLISFFNPPEELFA